MGTKQQIMGRALWKGQVRKPSSLNRADQGPSVDGAGEGAELCG